MLAFLLLSLCCMHGMAQDISKCIPVPLGGGDPVNLCGTIVVENNVRCAVTLEITAMNIIVLHQTWALGNSQPLCFDPAPGCSGCITASRSQVGSDVCFNLQVTCGSTAPSSVNLGCFPNIPSLATCLSGTSGSSTTSIMTPPPNSFSKCTTVNAGLNVPLCAIVSVSPSLCTLDTAFGVFQQPIVPVDSSSTLVLLRDGKHSSCVNVSPCKACLDITSAQLETPNRLTAKVGVSVKCSSFPSFSQNLGNLVAQGDFGNLQTLCNPCPSGCSNRGVCGAEGCVCTKPAYGTKCEFTTCSVTCDPDHGKCNSLTGICDCASGYEGNDCSKKQLNVAMVVVGVLGFFVVSGIVAAIVVWIIRRRRNGSNQPQHSDDDFASMNIQTAEDSNNNNDDIDEL